MHDRINNLLNIKFSDYRITLFVFIVGVTFTAFVLSRVKSLGEFFSGFSNPLIFAMYYLWIKAMFVEIRRIHNHDKFTNMPGFVYWIYGLQWVMYWMVNDMVFQSVQLKSVVYQNPSMTESLYLSNNILFWVIFDIAASAVLFPMYRVIASNKGSGWFLMIDYIKSIIVFWVFSLTRFI